MTTARAGLAALLKDQLPQPAEITPATPAWRVIGHGSGTLDAIQPSERVACLWASRLVPADTIAGDGQTVTLTLWLLTPLTDPERVEDDLEGMLATVLDVLHPVQGVVWEEAERDVFDETWHGFRLTLTAAHTVNYDTPEG